MIISIKTQTAQIDKGYYLVYKIHFNTAFVSKKVFRVRNSPPHAFFNFDTLFRKFKQKMYTK